MNCPKCNSDAKAINTCFNADENETYRRRVCTNEQCGHKFCTVEFPVEQNKRFLDDWKKAIKETRYKRRK